MNRTTIAVASILTISALTSANAAMRVAPLPPERPADITATASMQQAGTLTCMVQSDVGYVVGSSRTADCIFDHPGAQSYSQSYKATLSRVGVDVGVMPKQAMRWAVMTPGGVAEPGMLLGAHPGMSTEAAVAVGDGAKISFQDTGRQIAFQQMNAPMAFGVSFALGSSNLELTDVSAPVMN